MNQRQVDPDGLDELRAALDDSQAVDASRIDVQASGEEVVLRGSVASWEEADRAALIAEQQGAVVRNELQVDPALREGVVEPSAAEAAVPAEDEVLVGSVDMLAGPEAEITGDLERSLEENEPWDPPDAPLLAPTRAEARGAATTGVAGDFDDDTGEAGDEDRPAAADLTAQDLREAARGHALPALDPELDASAERPTPGPAGVDELGRSPTQADLGSMPAPLPGATAGAGATGESTAAGGALGGTPAPETGAAGRDTAAADPVRGASGGSMSSLGTEPGPPPEDEPALREDHPRH